MIILGIDPGYDRLGVAILENQGDKNVLLNSLCLQTDKSLSLSERIFALGQQIEELIKKWRPERLAIEKLFFTTNQKTAMGVSEARGAIIYVAKSSGLAIYEYTPLQIKIAIVGYGKATKDQVAYMLGILLKINKKDESQLDDESDAVAVALTCAVSEKNRYPQR